MKVRMKIEATAIGSASTTAWPMPEEEVEDAIVREVLDYIGTKLEVTIAGTTMFLDAWRNPEHWCEDWARKLGVEWEEVPAAVAALLAAAQEGTS